MAAEGGESWSDSALAEGIAAGGPAAAELEAELVRRFAPRVRLYGLRHLRGGHAEADDLVQRVLLLTLEKLREGQVRQSEKIGSFVLGTARTLVRTSQRSERLLLSDTATEGPEPVLLSQEPDPHLRRRVVDCFDTLAERERTLLVLTFVADQSADEIGSALGMQPTHVRVSRHRALARLRDCLGCQKEGAR